MSSEYYKYLQQTYAEYYGKGHGLGPPDSFNVALFLAALQSAKPGEAKFDEDLVI